MRVCHCVLAKDGKCCQDQEPTGYTWTSGSLTHPYGQITYVTEAERKQRIEEAFEKVLEQFQDALEQLGNL